MVYNALCSVTEGWFGKEFCYSASKSRSKHTISKANCWALNMKHDCFNEKDIGRTQWKTAFYKYCCVPPTFLAPSDLSLPLSHILFGVCLLQFVWRFEAQRLCSGIEEQTFCKSLYLFATGQDPQSLQHLLSSPCPRTWELSHKERLIRNQRVLASALSVESSSSDLL